ncbi:MAG: amidohydrolase family protein [Asticcacaulis sp.]
MTIDAHQHFWQIGRNGHEWPTPDLAIIHRDFGPADLTAQAAPAGVTASVLVQSQPSDVDTDWMIAVAADAPFVQGVVVWADLAAPDAAERLAHLAPQPKLKGVRPMLQGLADDNWILRPEVQPALKAVCDLGLRFDALVFSRHLPAIDALAKAWPGLPIVIDHCAKPPFTAPEQMGQWAENMARAAENPNVLCKLSGLFTELAPDQPSDLARACADHVLSVFGPDRLMWGSDWPVVLLRAPYVGWLDWTHAWLADKDSTIRDAVLSGTARRFYALD